MILIERRLSYGDVFFYAHVLTPKGWKDAGRICVQPRDGYITRFGVLDIYREQGIGSMLLRAAIKGGGKYLHALPSNAYDTHKKGRKPRLELPELLAYYQRHGFKPVQSSSHYQRMVLA